MRRSMFFDWKLRTGNCRRLRPDQRHHPSRHKNSTDEQREAVEAVLHLLYRRIALRDAKNHRGKKREHYRCRKVRQIDGHGFFPSAM